jgi:hypothetical protein
MGTGVTFQICSPEISFAAFAAMGRGNWHAFMIEGARFCVLSQALDTSGQAFVR